MVIVVVVVVVAAMALGTLPSDEGEVQGQQQMSRNDDIRVHEKLFCVQFSVPSFLVASRKSSKQELKNTATTTKELLVGAAIVVVFVRRGM